MKIRIVLLLIMALILTSCNITQTQIENSGEEQTNSSPETEGTQIPSISPVPTSTPIQTLSATQKPIETAPETGDTTKIGNTNSNLYHLGYVAYNDERQYFGSVSAPWMDDLYNEGLWSISNDGKDIKRISDDIPIYINVVDDYVYYIKQTHYYGDLFGSIIKIKKDGSEREVLVEDNCEDIMVIGGWIYFINHGNGNLYKISTAGSDLIKISNEKCISLQYNGDWLYYTVKNTENKLCTLYKIDIKSCSNPITISSDFVGAFLVYKDWIYYTQGAGPIVLYRIKIDGTDKMQLYDDGIYNFSVADDKIYFMADCEQYYPVLYGMDLDGSNVNEIFNESKIDLGGISGIAGQYIYFSYNAGEWMEKGRVKVDGSNNEALSKLLGNTDFVKNSH